MHKNTCTFLGCETEYGQAEIVLTGAPFDSTSSYRTGSKFAPNQIRIESFNAIETYSVYQDKDLWDLKVCDIGDMALPYGDVEGALDIIKAYFSEILADGKKPVMIGGEHLVTLGSIRACAERYPDLHVIHFDAHADLSDELLGQQLSHGTVMRRVWDILGDGKIYQMGIRSGDRDEFEFAQKHTYMCKFDCKDIDIIVRRLKGKPVYITLDVDVLDPSVMPGTGTPEAGGISFKELLESLMKCEGLNIIGADLNEVSPSCDPTGISVATACKILRELLFIL